MILYLMTSPMPSNVSCLCLLLAVDQRLHAMVIQAVWFDQIYYVEFVGLVFSSVGYTKVEPLTLLLRTSVIKFKLKIIFKFTDLCGSVKITTFKS